MTKALTYSTSGVNVAAGDSASDRLFRAARATWKNRQGKFGSIRSVGAHFRSVRFFELGRTGRDICLGINFDGIGSKVEFAERLGSYEGLATDLMAMTCDDAAVSWAEPLHFGSVLDMAKVDLAIVDSLARGLVRASTRAGVSVINGELAELPGRITGYGESPLNWSGACVWAADRRTLRRKRDVRIGDVLLGVGEVGFRSNGYSLLRAIFRRRFGGGWGTSRELVEFASQPSVIYTPLVLALTGGFRGKGVRGVKDFIHVTGGGLAGRCKYFGRTRHVGIEVGDPIRPPEQMIEIQKLGAVKSAEAYRTWNMGTGLIVVCTQSAVGAVSRIAARLSYVVKPIGTVERASRFHLRLHDGSIQR